MSNPEIHQLKFFRQITEFMDGFPVKFREYTSFQISEIFCQMDKFNIFQTFCQILESREYEA